MTRVALQFLSAQVHRGTPFIVDDASAHAAGFILAQKGGAVAGIGDGGWPERAFDTPGITSKAFGAATSSIRALFCDGYRSSYGCVFEKRFCHSSRQTNATMRRGKGRNIALVHRVPPPEQHRIRHSRAIKLRASRLAIFPRNK